MDRIARKKKKKENEEQIRALVDLENSNICFLQSFGVVFLNGGMSQKTIREGRMSEHYQ